MSFEKIMPLILLWLIWFVSVFNLRGHFRNRTMTAYLPRNSDSDLGPRSYQTTSSDHPVSYWLLFAFYSLVTLFVPAVTVYLIAFAS